MTCEKCKKPMECKTRNIGVSHAGSRAYPIEVWGCKTCGSEKEVPKHSESKDVSV